MLAKLTATAQLLAARLNGTEPTAAAPSTAAGRPRRRVPQSESEDDGESEAGEDDGGSVKSEPEEESDEAGESDEDGDEDSDADEGYNPRPANGARVSSIAKREAYHMNMNT